MNRALTVCLLLILTPVVYCQYDDSGPGYQLILFSNPGFTGTEGSGCLRMSYLNFYPGNNFDLHSFNVSYDSYFQGLHGGGGLFISNDNLGGIMNNIRGGLSYAYHFQAGRDFYISAGLSASMYHRGYDFSGAILPDQIDPLRGVVYPSGEIPDGSGRSVLDLATGFVFISGRFFWGLSVNHLAEPDPGYSEHGESRLKRRFLFHLAGDFDINEERNLKIRPLLKYEIQENNSALGAGAVLESCCVSIGSVILYSNRKNIDLQAGASILTGNVTFFYNYRFNIMSGNSLLPVSLLHHAGITVSLNDVEKRKVIKTINFPKL